MTRDELRELADAVASTRRLFSTGATHDDLVRHLCEQGCSKIESMIVLTDVVDLSLYELKRLVHFSEAFGDRYAQDAALHDAMEEIASRGAEGAPQ